MRNDRRTPPDKLTRDQIVSLDIATHTGFFTVGNYGTWDFTESLRRNDNKQHKAFHDTLTDFIVNNGIRQVVAEDVNVAGFGNHSFRATVKLAEFRGILLLVCDELQLPEPVFVNVTSIKRWATGDGRADKQKMMEYCKNRWHIDPKGDDNIADATHIYYYYLDTFDL